MDDKYTKLGMNFSYLERVMKIYYSKGLLDLDISWGQQYCLECIVERPGITAQELTSFSHVDKATVTKVLKKLVGIDYIEIRQSEKDRRVRHIYAKEEAIPAIKRIKMLHEEFYQDMTRNISEDEIKRMENLTDQMLHNLTQETRYKLEKGFLERSME